MTRRSLEIARFTRPWTTVSRDLLFLYSSLADQWERLGKRVAAGQALAAEQKAYDHLTESLRGMSMNWQHPRHPRGCKCGAIHHELMSPDNNGILIGDPARFLS